MDPKVNVKYSVISFFYLKNISKLIKYTKLLTFSSLYPTVRYYAKIRNSFKYNLINSNLRINIK